MEKPLHILEIMKIIKQRKAEICNRGGTGIGTENIKIRNQAGAVK